MKTLHTLLCLLLLPLSAPFTTAPSPSPFLSSPLSSPLFSSPPPPPSDFGAFGSHVPKLNTVTLVGRTGADCVPRYFDNGNVVVNVGLACTRKYHPAERKVRDVKYGAEETDWFNLEIWGRDAEYMSKYVKKGTRIGIQGTLGIQKWTDKKTGKERSSPKIRVTSLDVLETRKESELREKSDGRSASDDNGFWDNKSTPRENTQNENKYFE